MLSNQKIGHSKNSPISACHPTRSVEGLQIEDVAEKVVSYGMLK